MHIPSVLLERAENSEVRSQGTFEEDDTTEYTINDLDIVAIVAQMLDTGLTNSLVHA